MRVQYFVSDSGYILPRKKAYRKARFKRYMSRQFTYFMEKKDRKARKNRGGNTECMHASW